MPTPRPKPPKRPRGRRTTGAGKALEISRFPIVGIGASAGGLDALERLLKRISGDCGMAFLVVQHLDPKHESRLSEILSRSTSLPVSEVEDGTRVRPNHVYVIPPNTNMLVRRRVLRLEPRDSKQGVPLPIDFLFRSLASAEKNHAIGVILSGTASDGALGVEAIKAEGGITFAQDAVSAKYFGMPHSSIVTGAVDFVMPPEEIATYLAKVGKHPYLQVAETEGHETPSTPEQRDEALSQILLLLKRRFGVDFSRYKAATVGRRITRRMALRTINDLSQYLRYLRQDPEEARGLYQDMFIGVTGFFREPETFEALQKTIFPRLMKNRPEDSPIRVWVPGCSTGEEVYSIAIALLEFLKDKAGSVPIQIFGTDVNEDAVRRARTGRYAEDVVANVDKKRLQRFFVKAGEAYVVSQVVRDLCVFARHDIARDPPFSRLDLLSCRNVLIYLDTDLQRRLMPLFHYGLKATGFLLLGAAETIGGLSDLFALSDRKNKIYAKKPAFAPIRFDAAQVRADEPVVEPLHEPPPRRIHLDLQKEAADLIILNQYGPAAVLVSESMEILHFRGHTGAYLEPAPGTASLNLLRMAREGLLMGLRSALQSAKKKNIPIQVDGLRVAVNGAEKIVNLHVVPVRTPASKQRGFLVLFEEARTSASPPKGPGSRLPPPATREYEARIAQMKQEVLATKGYLQSVIEDQQASSEELRSLNEELQSANEELQSTTEELETSNEELQSANEELMTLNEEMQHRNAELAQVHGDLLNVLRSMQLGVIIVDRDLKIRRITQSVPTQLNVLPGDVGRPLTDIRIGIELGGLKSLITGVIDSATAKKLEVRGQDGKWYSFEVHPYLVGDSQVEGAVLALVDINAVKLAETKFRALIESAPDAMVIVGPAGEIRIVNAQAERIFGYKREELLGKPVEILVSGQLSERHALHRAEHTRNPDVRLMGSLELFGKRQDGTEFPVEIFFSPIETPEGLLVASTIRDVTDRKALEAGKRAAVLNERNRLAREVHDSLAQGLSGIVVQLEGAEDVLSTDPERARQHVAQARDLARASLEEARRALLALRPQTLQDGDLPGAIERFANRLTAGTDLKIDVSIRGERFRLPPPVEESLLRIAQEALNNSAKHARANRIHVDLTYGTGSVRLRVQDDGVGFDTASTGDSGIGLPIMRERSAQIGAQLTIRSHSGKGTRVEVNIGPSATA